MLLSHAAAVRLFQKEAGRIFSLIHLSLYLVVIVCTQHNLQLRAAVCCSVAQCTAVCCRVPQCVAVCCSVPRWAAGRPRRIACLFFLALHYTATKYTTHCTTRCNTLHHTATPNFGLCPQMSPIQGGI